MTVDDPRPLARPSGCPTSDRSSTRGTPLIELRSVTLGYEAPILSEIEFTINAGDFLGIVGPNGVGKTTLLKAILRVVRPLKGEIAYMDGGQVIRFGYVPQRQAVDELFPLTALDTVLMGRYRRIGFFRAPGAADRRHALECLAHVGLEGLAERAYRELSGGQKQRVLLARALACEPTVLVLDEPTTDMDLPSERGIMDLVEQLAREAHLTVLIVSHLLHVVVNRATRLAFVGDGSVRVQPIEEALTPENLSALYGVPVSVGNVGGKRFVL